jgi:hypothetical protein
MMLAGVERFAKAVSVTSGRNASLVTVADGAAWLAAARSASFRRKVPACTQLTQRSAQRLWAMRGNAIGRRVAGPSGGRCAQVRHRVIVFAGVARRGGSLCPG